jgi:amidohydrolase
MNIKSAALEAIGRAEAELVTLSHRIHANPELGFEEEQASRWVSEVLAQADFEVESGVAGLPTAFEARFGSGSLNVGICAEYDALPQMGHACGHNIIAAAAVGAGLALRRIADDVGITVRVFGTPAEEGGGGKIRMLDNGVFEGVHAAMMVHPTSSETVTFPALAMSHFEVHYTGRSTHPAIWPELGVNAEYALEIARTSIGLLRQYTRPTDHVDGILLKGGILPNAVPEHASAKYFVRAKDLLELEELEGRVRRCFEAGALATGAELEIVPQSSPYSEFRHDPVLAAFYLRNAEALGRDFPAPDEPTRPITPSTDMANVSLAVPSIHPLLKIDSLPVVNHTPEFARSCISPAGDRAIRDGAAAMAWTAIDAATDDATREYLISRSPNGASAEGTG